jgi:hypothetical protein
VFSRVQILVPSLFSRAQILSPLYFVKIHNITALDLVLARSIPRKPDVVTEPNGKPNGVRRINTAAQFKVDAKVDDFFDLKGNA